MLELANNIFLLPFFRVIQTFFICIINYFSIKINAEDIDYGLVIIVTAVIINLLLFFIYQRIIDIVEIAKRNQGIKNRILSHLMLFVKIWFFIIIFTTIRDSMIFNEKPGLYVTEFGDYVESFMVLDVLKPDGLIELETITINLIPILFTLISIVSLVLYYIKEIKEHRKVSVNNKDLFIFLINSIDPLLYVVILSVVLYNIGTAVSLFYLVGAFFTLIRVVLNRYIFKKTYDDINTSLPRDKQNIKMYNILAIILLFTWTLITGVMIPSQVMSVSPAEFVTFGQSPLYIIAYTFGIFFIYAIYGFLVYVILTEKQKKYFLIVMSVICAFAIFNFMLFGNGFGIITVMLAYDGNEVYYSITEKLINIGLLIIIIAAVLFLTKYKTICKNIIIILCISVFLFSGFNVFRLYSTTKNVTMPPLIMEEDLKPIYTLSTNKKNVIVLMLDRITGSFLPYIFEQLPELKDQYDGFTYYPNTISFGRQTTSGTPGLFGGYEYIPVESDKDKSKLVLEKHNDALTLMPRVFGENGYNVVCSNLPDINYWDNTRPNPFKGLKNVTQKSIYGRIDSKSLGIYKQDTIDTQKINFTYFSFMRTVPCFFQEMLYNGGGYTYINNKFKYTQTFINFFLLIKNYIRLIDAKNTKRGTVIITDNACAHEAMTLSYPDFDLLKPGDIKVSSENVVHDDSGFPFELYDYYGTCVAVMKNIGKLLDHIKAIGAYDNTRIILVSDHGYPYTDRDAIRDVEPSKISKYKSSSIEYSTINYDALLMVKDFDSHGFNVSDEFMTNADTPYIAVKGLIKNPKNNLTGRPITDDYKKKNKKIYLAHSVSPWQPSMHQDEYQHETVNRAFLEVDTRDIWDIDKWIYIKDYVSNECIDKAGHKLTFHRKTKKETCGINFLQDVYECQKCHKYFEDSYANNVIRDTTEYIEEKPHQFVDYVSNEDFDISKEIHGTMIAKCIYGCGEEDTKYDQNPKGYHDINKQYLKPATTEEDGYEAKVCTICDYAPEAGKEIIKKAQKIELEYLDTTFNNDYQRPEIKVYDADNNLISDENYNVKYDRSLAIGIATAEAKFKKKYEGTISQDYIIHPNAVKSIKASIDGDVLKIIYDAPDEKVDGYEIEYSTSATFDESHTEKIKIRKQKNQEVNIEDIKDAYKVNLGYIRIRPYRTIQDNVIYGDFVDDVILKE